MAQRPHRTDSRHVAAVLQQSGKAAFTKRKGEPTAADPPLTVPLRKARRLLRRQYHEHLAAFHARIAFHLRGFGDIGLHALIHGGEGVRRAGRQAQGLPPIESLDNSNTATSPPGATPSPSGTTAIALAIEVAAN